ncbi:glycosyltransferase family 2 protein [Salinisphaera sp. Q1T1-3]|uniref:glycosyltransferase n=1 Tax=Salinisphaera sp. Q1T1-3 TaxID=2321229 RepID=UPI000E707056|nr:glycosyltransferase [Salinisphaera sp. Q1T1-3]RJS94274.1 glycosyltransferase [Salinisphaera sp. Q1T1-3]
MTTLALVALALAGLYACLTAINLTLFRVPRPERHGNTLAISLLIPARDESRRIEATLQAALASRDIALEIIVLDDGSSDDTAARVAALAEHDARVRLIAGRPLPTGYNGKQYACAQLAAAACHDTLVFIDADVHLGPDALARAAGWLHRRRLGLASGFPRQITGSWGEMLLVPMIPVLLLGYLPIPLARLLPRAPSLAAGCGQFMLVTRTAYEAAGGHAACVQRMHDGLNLPANVRRAGHASDLFNAAGLASCRMYDGFTAAWHGFSKDATEGMATPRGLPIWTVLLIGGHWLPCLVFIAAIVGATPASLTMAATALGLLIAARLAVAVATHQSMRAVLCHPAAVVTTLALQWRALILARLGRPRAWRGRFYEP